MNPLNSPVEVGIRALVMLVEHFPAGLDVDRLSMLDHVLVHSGDFGGPASLHPPIPGRSSELSVKKGLMEDGLRILARARLVNLQSGPNGFEFKAGEGAASFLNVLHSPLLGSLRSRAEWVHGRIEVDETDELSELMAKTFRNWRLTDPDEPDQTEELNS